MPRLNELPVGDSIIQLVYGAAGSGKTEYCGTAGSRTMLINCGLGIVTLQSPGFKKRHPNVNPIIETVYEDYIPKEAKAFDQISTIIETYLDPKHPDYNNIDTIIIDDATALKRFAQNMALEINRDLQKSKSYAESQKQGVMIMAVQDYGQEMNNIDQFLADRINLFRAHNKNFILTAHERISFNKPSKIGDVPTINSIRPGFTGQTFPDSVTGHFDLVWHLETQGGGDRIFYNARTAGDSALVAKTRWSGLFPVMVKDPNFLNVVKTIRDSK